MPAKISEFIEYYKNKLMYFLLLTGGICGAIGSYLYYVEEVKGYRLFLTVLFSTIKLYFFSPTVGLTENYSYFYEIAKWMAPMGTVLSILSAFGNMLNKLLYTLKEIGAPKIVLFGNGEEALQLLSTLIQEKSASGLMLGRGPGVFEKDLLLAKGIRYMDLDLEGDTEKIRRNKLKKLRPERLSHLIFFEEDLRNVINAGAIQSYLPKNRQTSAVLRTSSTALCSVMEGSMDRLQSLDLRFFNPDLAAARQLCRRLSESDSLLAAKNISAGMDFTALCAELGSLHILILGFDGFGQAFLLESINSLVSNPLHRNCYTLVDGNLRDAMEKLRGQYLYLEETCEIQELQADVFGRDFYGKLQEIEQRQRIDVVLFALEDTSANIIMMDRLKGMMSGKIAALRTESRAAFQGFEEDLQEFYSHILPFGIREEVLNSAYVLEDVPKQRAMNFNFRYNGLCTRIMFGEPDIRSIKRQWEDLNLLKKESCMSQAAHEEMKALLLRKFADKGLIEKDRKALIAAWEKKISARSAAEMADIIEAHPVMCYMAALEHRRWCNFYYLKNFRYGAVKNEKEKIHDCLNSDWKSFAAGSKRETIVYDFISVLNMRE